MSNNTPHLGPAIRVLRWPNTYTKPKMTQADLADKLGVSEGLVCRWEHGRRGYHPSDSIIQQVCRIFRVSRTHLSSLASDIATKKKGQS